MRVFDTLTDVRTYFQEEEKKARSKADEIVALPPVAGPGSSSIKRTRVRDLAAARASAHAYHDAAQALTEIRPGLIDALTSGQVKLVVPERFDDNAS